MSDAPLSTVYTIRQVAKMAGWSYSRRRRHLLAKHEELDGGLLVNVGRGAERPRWTITLAALRALSPQWFLDPEETQRRIDFLDEENRELRARVEFLDRRLDAQTQRIVSLAKERRAG